KAIFQVICPLVCRPQLLSGKFQAVIKGCSPCHRRLLLLQELDLPHLECRFAIREGGLSGRDLLAEGLVRGIERFIPELLQGEGDAIWQFRELASRHIAKAGTQVGPPHFEMFLDRIGGTTADAHSDPLGTSRYEVIQFAFECYGFETFHVLVNPSHPLVQTVLTSMVESGEYFILCLRA